MVSEHLDISCLLTEKIQDIKAEFEHPSRDSTSDTTIDAPRDFILHDFSSSVREDEKRTHDTQPNVYRSPEVILKMKWSYPADIWNVGVNGSRRQNFWTGLQI
jgi:hypothetical protein